MRLAETMLEGGTRLATTNVVAPLASEEIMDLFRAAAAASSSFDSLLDCTDCGVDNLHVATTHVLQCTCAVDRTISTHQVCVYTYVTYCSVRTYVRTHAQNAQVFSAPIASIYLGAAFLARHPSAKKVPEGLNTIAISN